MTYDPDYVREVEAKYKAMWYGLQCALCGWWVNERSPEEAFVALRRHRESHPEWERYQASLPSPEELRRALHEGHDCNPGPCPCECGCMEPVGCTVIFGPLCSVCYLRDMRGDKEHGIPTGDDENEEERVARIIRIENAGLGGSRREMFRPAPSVAITPEPFSVFVDNQLEVGLSHAPRWVLAISHDAVLVADDKERRLVWVPMANCRLKLADS